MRNRPDNPGDTIEPPLGPARFNGFADTFERVEHARHRISELVRDSTSLPNGDEIASRIGRTASHCWGFWIAPQPALPALLISGSWNLSAFLLSGMFSRVDVWDIDERRASILARVAAEANAGISVQHCPPARILDRLQGLVEPYGLAAMQDALGSMPRRSRTVGGVVFDRLAAVTSKSGQCCVVGRNRFSRKQVSPLCDPGLAAPTPAELKRGWIAAGGFKVEEIFFHPNHEEPSEILFRPTLVPEARRGRRSMRILERLGVIERVLGSFASFAPLHRGSLLIDQASAWWHGEAGTSSPPRSRECRVRGGAMMFVDLVLADGGEAILRVPLLRESRDALARAAATHADLVRTVPAAISGLIPESRPMFRVAGWPMHLERKCRGVPARAVLRSEAARSRVRTEIADFVNLMCAETIARHPADEAFTTKHIGAKVDAVSAIETALASDLALVGSATGSLLRGTLIPTVRMHGDLTVNNVFVDPNSFTLAGIIDWETSLSGSLPFDLIHYLIAERREFDPQPWGVLVAQALSGRLFDAESGELLRVHFANLGLEEAALKPLLVAYWLRGVHLRQVKSGGRLVPDWREKNLVGPLGSIRGMLTT